MTPALLAPHRSDRHRIDSLGGARGAAALLALFALSLAPTLFVDIPAMVDYPNHLARMSILARDGTPEANPFYEVAWRFYPNLAMDVIVPGLARLVGVEAATKAFLVASQILLVSGAMAIALAARRRPALSGVMALLYLHSWPFAFGFLNFAFALGIALWGVAAWIRLESRPLALRLLVHGALVAALMVAHMVALGIYGFTIGVIELRRTVRVGPRDPRALAIYPLMAAPAVALTLLMARAGGAIGGTGTAWSLPGKFLALNCINGDNAWASILTTLALLVTGLLLARRGWMRLEGPGAWLAAAFAALFLAMPLRLFDTAMVDMRIMVAAALILPAFIVIDIPGPRARAAAMAVVAGVALVNLGTVAAVQMSYRDEYRRIIASFDLLGTSPRILVAHGGDGVDPPADLAEYPIFHAPVLAVHYARAFVPTLFAYPGKQPVSPRPEVAGIAPLVSNLEPLETLRRVALGVAQDAPDAVAHWTRDFDYLYVVGPLVENPLPGRLTPISEGRRYRAYRIERLAGETRR